MKWISVDEKMPESRQKVIIWGKFGLRKNYLKWGWIEGYHYGNDWYASDDDIDIYEATHWMIPDNPDKN